MCSQSTTVATCCRWRLQTGCQISILAQISTPCLYSCASKYQLFAKVQLHQRDLTLIAFAPLVTRDLGRKPKAGSRMPHDWETVATAPVLQHERVLLFRFFYGEASFSASSMENFFYASDSICQLCAHILLLSHQAAIALINRDC